MIIFPIMQAVLFVITVLCVIGAVYEWHFDERKRAILLRERQESRAIVAHDEQRQNSEHAVPAD
jgi:hypothetical protein